MGVCGVPVGPLWYSSKDYAYGWVVPLLCLALFWERLKHRPAPELLKASTGPLIVFSVLALTLRPSCLLLESEYGTISGRSFAEPLHVREGFASRRLQLRRGLLRGNALLRWPPTGFQRRGSGAGRPPANGDKLEEGSPPSDGGGQKKTNRTQAPRRVGAKELPWKKGSTPVQVFGG
jgi:hypothetical protein